jgi:hypothetical protein
VAATVTASDDQILQQYTERLLERRAAFAADERRHALLSYLRLAIAAAAVVLLAWGGLNRAAWLVVPLVVFVGVAIAHARLLNERDRRRSAIGFYERGLARIRHQWIGAGREGQQYRVSDHLYCDDLDLFGRGSLFELLATTRTRAGEETLARWLLDPAPHEVARSRQRAVSELAGRPDLREQVAVIGDEVKVAVDAPLLRRWAARDDAVGSAMSRLGVGLLVAATVVTLVVWLQTGSGDRLLLVLLAAQLAAASYFRHRVTEVIAAVEEPSHDLDVLTRLLQILERETFDSDHLQRLQRSLGAGSSASGEIARLSRLVALLASRRNVLFVIPSGLLMWATQWAFAIGAWKARSGRHVGHWLDVVGEFEALLALGTFAAEHPSFTFPELTEGAPEIVATQLAHATLGPQAVANDLALGGAGRPRLLMVSGSNMSGKSTWMRSIGVAVVLARMGAPVAARMLRLTPLAVGAAIRVQDSLTDGRSRFFAEILRVKHVVDLARTREGAVLFLLDEILSGTNSHDRRIGAQAVMQSLVAAGAIGVVTTHDLALADPSGPVGSQMLNTHFDDRFEDGTLTFDYRLKPGVVETSNALALMRSIGIEV